MQLLLPPPFWRRAGIISGVEVIHVLQALSSGERKIFHKIFLDRLVIWRLKHAVLGIWKLLVINLVVRIYNNKVI